MPRLFLAIELPEAIKDELTKLQDLFRPEFEEVLRITSRENLHLTLKFLGETESDDAARLRVSLPSIVREAAPFRLHLSTTGVFPPRGRPRVIWVGTNEHSEIAFCHHQVETACAALGFTRESRPFSPHVTLARVREARGQRRSLRAFCEQLALQPCQLEVAELALFVSHPTSCGSEYEVIERARFGANRAKT